MPSNKLDAIYVTSERLTSSTSMQKNIELHLADPNWRLESVAGILSGGVGVTIFSNTLSLRGLFTWRLFNTTLLHPCFVYFGILVCEIVTRTSPFHPFLSFAKLI